MQGIYPNYNQMGGAPVDMKIYRNGLNETYYCMALTGTANALTDEKFKILRKISVGGVTDSMSHAFSVLTGKGGHKYELPATDLATVQSYTYNIT